MYDLRKRTTNSIHHFEKILLLLPLFYFIALSSLSATRTNSSKYFELNNGLKVFLHQRKDSPLVNIVVGVNAGSKDETRETNGLIHLLEHCILFRGTQFRKGFEVGLEIRRHGAYFNAHTGQDIAFFEIVLPSEHLYFGLKNQREILFDFKLTGEELEEEKKVVLEELNEIQDDPYKTAIRITYENLFRGHPYEHPVSGIKENIEKATVEQIENFHRKYFVPPNCALAVVGNFEIEDAETKVTEVFGSLEKKETPLTKFEKVPPLAKTIELTQEMDVNQAYMVIGMIGPDYNHPDQYAIDLLTEILGRGVNPLLNLALKGRRKIAHTISMNYSALKYGGAILISLTLDEKNIKLAKSATIDFLRETRRQNYSKKDFYGEDEFYAWDYLESAKNRIEFNIQQNQEKGLSVAISLVTHMLLSENSRTNYFENIFNTSSSDLREAAGKYLSTGKYVITSIIPKKDKK